MRRVLLFAFLAIPLITSCDRTYLDREQFDLPVNSTTVVTTKPLERRPCAPSAHPQRHVVLYRDPDGEEGDFSCLLMTDHPPPTTFLLWFSS